MSQPTYTFTAATACSGTNELGMFTGKTVAWCAGTCDADSSCVSFEYRSDISKCQMSSSCTATHANYGADANFDIFIRGPAAAPASNYRFIAGRVCTGENGLGAFLSETLVTCAARCDAAAGCLSFEFRSSDGKCQVRHTAH